MELNEFTKSYIQLKNERQQKVTLFVFKAGMCVMLNKKFNVGILDRADPVRAQSASLLSGKLGSLYIYACQQHFSTVYAKMYNLNIYEDPHLLSSIKVKTICIS